MKRPDPVGRDQAPDARESDARSKDDDSADRRGIEPRGTKVSASDDVISPFAGSTPGARAKPAAVSRSHSNAIRGAMTEIIEHTDGQRINEDGHTVRFMLPAWRHDQPITGGVCTDRVMNGRRVRSFSIQKGDLSASEARQYAGRLKDAPARAMAVFDVSRADVRLPGKPMRASFTINVHPGLLMTHDWCGICQYNSRPNPGERWRNPPFAIGMKPRARNSREEVFYVDLTTFPTAGSQEQGRHVDLGPKAVLPLKRDRPYAFVIDFVDGAGGDGLLKVRVDDRLIVDYVGPTGYANFAGCFFAYGLYRSPWCPGCEGLSASFTDVVEGAVG